VIAVAMARIITENRESTVVVIMVLTDLMHTMVDYQNVIKEGEVT